jgi:hypothetical protein
LRQIGSREHRAGAAGHHDKGAYAMSFVRRAACVAAVGLAVMVAGASAASATTLYVSTGGNDLNPCTSPAAACKTIGAAVAKSEAAPDAATINVAAGVYPEVVNLSHAADDGIVIVGAGSGPGGTEIEGQALAKKSTVNIVAQGNTTTLSNLSIVTPAGDEENGISNASTLTLNNVLIDMQAASSRDGIVTGESGGSLTFNGGGVKMESGTKGAGIIGALAPLALNGVTVTMASGSSGIGIESEFGPASLNNVAVNVASTAGSGIVMVAGGPSFNGVSVAMGNPASTQAGVVVEFGASTLEHLEVAGAWKGPALESVLGSTTLSDSRLISDPASTNPTLVDIGSSELPGLVVQRSVLQDATTATPGTLLVAEGGNVTLDSSEVLGGRFGVAFNQAAGKVRRLTLAGTTLDAGVLGVADAPPVRGVAVESAGIGSRAEVAIEGSIVLESQSATVGAGGNEAGILCNNSDVPDQTQAASGVNGAIACANVTAANTTSSPASLFVAPGTNYGLNPSSTAVDSVPAAALTLPFGLGLTSTDLAGNPRVLDGNGDCLAVQDKGALELQGHSVSCPPPPPPPVLLAPKPLAGVITALTLSPNAFSAAPSGATVSSAKRKYGTLISYRDSQAATTTLTVLLPVAGRMQGRSCKKPGKANRHGRRCTFYRALGSFTHTDRAGANSLHFSGRLHGKKLARGSYRLQAVPHNAAGNGAVAGKSFTIKK